jgi:hypothetical protein
VVASTKKADEDVAVLTGINCDNAVWKSSNFLTNNTSDIFLLPTATNTGLCRNNRDVVGNLLCGVKGTNQLVLDTNLNNCLNNDDFEFVCELPVLPGYFYGGTDLGKLYSDFQYLTTQDNVVSSEAPPF